MISPSYASSIFTMGETWAMTSSLFRRFSLSKLHHNHHHHHNNTSRRPITTTVVESNTRDELPDRTESSATRLQKKEKLPLAVHLLDNPSSVDEQDGSPLFTKLPIELREMIWDYALMQYQDTDALYPLYESYARPGQAAPMRVAVELLRTCRAVYLEAFLVPFKVNPMTVFDGHPDVVPPNNILQCTSSNLRLCRKLRPWQFANVTSFEMNVQQFMLEGGAVERVSRLAGAKGRHLAHEAQGFTLSGYASFKAPKDQKSATLDTELHPGTTEARNALVRSIFAGKKITHLKIRMSHSDWWSWTVSPEIDEYPQNVMRLEPMINVTDRQEVSLAMRKGYEARKEGNEPDFNLDDFEKDGRWGMQFAEYWPDLQTLEIVLETYAQKEKQLDSVVECAKLWTFPLNGGSQLQWDGQDEATVRWQGAKQYAFDEELGMCWAKDQSKADSQDDSAPLTRWRPAGDKETMGGQVFVMKSLVFNKRKCQQV
ncbi:hypothetical protein GGR57DRAFT_377387 [Xylariaceae sp. FL1272]|nr:hypothetical protein GGR57DRAFT_377387 [Xylariaceae sp. FL1272]